MMSVVAHQHKKEAVISFILLGLASGLLIAFFTIDIVRFKVYDAYNSVFKVVITDRVLRDEARIYSDLSYCNSDNPRQTLDIYVPRVATKYPLKLVIFIHGGGWRAGDKSGQIMTYYSEDLLKKGVAVASLNYRLYPEVTYPGPNDDIACAIRYLSDNASKYNIADNKWIVFGDSAGAQLGAYAMSDPAINSRLSTFIGFYGPYDLREQITRIPRRDNEAWNYTNKGKDARKASPYLRTPKADATYLLFHGQADKTVYYTQSDKFNFLLQAQSINSSYTLVKHAPHYFSPRSEPSANEIKKQIINTIVNSR